MHDPTSRLKEIAYYTATRVLHNPMLAEEAGEEALHRFTLAVLAGRTPACPDAWIRVVARRCATGLARGPARMLPLEHDPARAEEVRDGSSPREVFDHLQARIQTLLTQRQRAALTAALTCKTTRSAARSIGMTPRDFRRYLAIIGRKARRCWLAAADLPTEAALAEDSTMAVA